MGKGKENGGWGPGSGLVAQGIAKKYKGFALRDVSFRIPPGSITGLLGRNGAGKTTVMRILAGHTRKDGGKIWADGMDLKREREAALAKIGFVIEGRMFFEKKSLWENGQAFGDFYPGFTEKSWKGWLRACHLQADARLDALSKGERSKFQFAFAMAHHPKVLLLDEPTGNLDPVFRKEFLDLLLETVEREQISVLYSSHLTADLERIADQIVLLEQGSVLYADSMDRLTARYCLVKGGPEEGRRIKEGNYPEAVGVQVTRVGFEAMLDLEKEKSGGPSILEDFPGLRQEEADLEKWMCYMLQERGRRPYVEEDQAV